MNTLKQTMTLTRFYPRFAAAAAAIAFLPGTAFAADVYKANNTQNLNLGASWVSGTAPTSNDVAYYDNTVIGTSNSSSIGTGLSVKGLVLMGSGSAANVTITGSNSLNIGSSGIDLQKGSITLSAPVTLADSQVWTLSSSTRINLSNGLASGANSLSIQGSSTSTTLSLQNVTLGENVGVGALTNMYVAGGTVTLTTTNNLVSAFSAFGNSTVNVALMGDSGASSSIGKAAQPNVRGGSTMNYTGVTASSNKGIQRDIPTADATFNVTNAAATLTMSGSFSTSGANGSGVGWKFGGDGNLVLNGNVANAASGSGVTLTKLGAGTLTLNGASTYAGATTISSGRVIVGGTLVNTVSVTLAAGTELNVNGALNAASLTTVSGTLSGAGTVGHVSVQSGGVLSPGNSAGILTTGSLTLLGGGKYTLEIKTDGSTGGAGTDWDRVAASALDIGSLDISANRFTFTLKTLAASGEPGGLADWNKDLNHTWSGILSWGSLNGAFDAGKFVIDTTGFGNLFDGSFALVQNGNQVDLVYLAVPEPGTWAMVVGGFGVLLFTQRLRRRKSL